MRKIFASAAALGFFALAAYAAEVEGAVQGVDLETRTILLEDGTSFIAAESVDLSDIELGTVVKITYDEATMQATMVETGM